MQTKEKSLIDLETQRKADARVLLDYWEKNEPYKLYTPNGKCEEFIKLVGEDQTFICLFSAANGVGKTAVGCNILANLMFETDNEWFKGLPLFENFKYPKRGRIVSDPTTVQSTILDELEKWLPKGRYTKKKKGKNYDYEWKTDTDHEFDVMTYEQNPKEFESKTLGWAWFDEPPPEAIFKATVARMRTGGIIFITATPLTGSAWMYDQIMTNPKQGQRQYVEADVWANSVSKGVRGRLTDRDIDRMIAEYSEEDKQARIYGKFQHLTGLVFKMFDRKIHVIKPFEVTKEDYIVLERLDPHPRNPDAVLWLAIDKNNTKFVIDELYLEGMTDELAMRIKRVAGNYRVVDRRIDPAAFVEDQHTKRSLAKDLYSLGLNYLPASKARSHAIQRIKDALDYRSAGEQITRPPELYIFDTCQRLIWEMEHWQYHEHTGVSAERKSRSEKPMDKDDHMIENLGRALIEEVVWFPMEKPRHRTIESAVPILDPYDN